MVSFNFQPLETLCSLLVNLILHKPHSQNLQCYNGNLLMIGRKGLQFISFYYYYYKLPLISYIDLLQSLFCCLLMLFVSILEYQKICMNFKQTYTVVNWSFSLYKETDSKIVQKLSVPHILFCTMCTMLD